MCNTCRLQCAALLICPAAVVCRISTSSYRRSAMPPSNSSIVLSETILLQVNHCTACIACGWMDESVGMQRRAAKAASQATKSEDCWHGSAAALALRAANTAGHTQPWFMPPQTMRAMREPLNQNQGWGLGTLAQSKGSRRRGRRAALVEVRYVGLFVGTGGSLNARAGSDGQLPTSVLNSADMARRRSQPSSIESIIAPLWST